MELFIRKTSPHGFLKYVCFSNLHKEKKIKTNCKYAKTIFRYCDEKLTLSF